MATDASKSDEGAGPGLRQRLDDALMTLRGRLRDDKKGWVHLAVAAVVTLVLSAALYWPLGLPGRILTRILTKATDGSCVTSTTGIVNWFCGMGISLVAMSGAIVVLIAMLLLRRQIRKGGAQAVKQTPSEFHFLEKPVVVTLAFAMAWSSVLFHFYGRMGLIIDGLFPAFVGLLMFALTFWEAPIKTGLRPVWPYRERLPKVGRIVLVILVPVLLGFLMTGWMPFSIRDQLAALIAVFVGWVMWTAAPDIPPEAPRRPTRATGAALLMLLALAVLLVVATPVAAQGPCADFDLYIAFAICENAHHSGTFGGASAGVGIGATAVVLAPARPEPTEVEEKEPEEEEEPAKDVDPCADLQGSFDALRSEWIVLNDFIQTQERFIQAREEEYRIRNESTFWSQTTDLAFMGAGLATGGGQLAGTALGRVAQAAEGALKPIVVAEILKQAMVEGGKTNAMEVAYAVINKTSSGAVDKQHEQVLKQLQQVMVDDMADKFASMGIPKDSPQYASAILKWSNDAQDVVDMIGGIAKVGSGAVGLWNMFGQYSSLKEFSDKIHQLRLRLIDKRGELDMLADKLRPAKYDLENCRERVAMGLEP